MFARVTTYQGKTDSVGEMESRLDGIASQVSAIPGVANVHTLWNDDGSGMTVAIYDSEAAATAAATTIQGIWGGLADLLAGPPSAATYSSVHKLA